MIQTVEMGVHLGDYDNHEDVLAVVLFTQYSHQTSQVHWYRTSFGSFASEFAALALSIISVAEFVLSFSQNHEQNNAMLSTLYGDTSELTNRAQTSDNRRYGAIWATKTFEKKIKSRRELSFSCYLTYLLFWISTNMCCCFRTCCNRVNYLRNGASKFKKFNLALDRLNKEQDIQYLIEMNRVSRLLHKATLLTRQRLSINYSHKYTISEKDIRRARGQQVEQADKSPDASKILDGFDPENSMQDRRMLFEITGMRLRTDEFQELDSSDSGGDDQSEELLPSDFAFMERFLDDDEEITAINP